MPGVSIDPNINTLSGLKNKHLPVPGNDIRRGSVQSVDSEYRFGQGKDHIISLHRNMFLRLIP